MKFLLGMTVFMGTIQSWQVTVEFHSAVPSCNEMFVGHDCFYGYNSIDIHIKTCGVTRQSKYDEHCIHSK